MKIILSPRPQKYLSPSSMQAWKISLDVVISIDRRGPSLHVLYGTSHQGPTPDPGKYLIMTEIKFPYGGSKALREN